MKLIDIKKIYNERAKNLGINPATVGWSSWEQQNLRFKILTRNLEINHQSRILDLGCGLGNLIDYLKLKFPSFKEQNYSGWDVSNELIKIASEKYPNSNFSCINFWESSNLNHEYDFIFMSGALNFNIEDECQYESLEQFLALFSTWSSVKISFNLIHDYVDYKDKNLRYYNIPKVINLIENYSKNWIIYKDYPLWEFTVQLTNSCDSVSS
jgi:2-polyprenyl-3-methyl-5-hydroxy-6-metoxy-1,4-benzoquinol methylase